MSTMKWLHEMGNKEGREEVLFEELVDFFPWFVPERKKHPSCLLHCVNIYMHLNYLYHYLQM